MNALVKTIRRLARVSVILASAVAFCLMTAAVASAHVYRLEGGPWEAPASSHALLIGIVTAAAAAVACTLIVLGLRRRRGVQRPAAASPVGGPSVEREYPKAA